MTTAQTRTPAEVARAAFDAVAKRDADAVAALTTETTVDDFVAIGEVRGPDAIRKFFLDTFAAFPDFSMTADRIVADEEAAVVQWHATGTFSGAPFQGIEPTGKHVELRGVDVMEVANGHVRRNTIYYDGASFARQIGMLPQQGSGADRAIMTGFNAVTKLRKQVAR
jgi:steroid delta-isomerase-like uncharacterized protein